MNRPSAAGGPSDSAKPELSPGQRGLTQLIEYVRVLIELGEKPVWSLASYNNVVLHEDDLRNRIGIRHDLTDIDGPIYLKIDRLRRTDPPEPPTAAKDWLTVSRDPFKEPVIQSLRMTVMAADEAERLIAQGAVDRADVTKALKPKPGADLRDVVLRLNRFPEAKANVEDYIAQAWTQWAQSERPRRETIDIYDRLFSLQQALKLEGSDRPLEVVWGMGVARWKVPPHELDHPIVEQLVELELDEAAAVLVRPRAVDPIIALKAFAAMDNPGTDLVARFAREHFSKLPPERELSPFEKETFTPILRYGCAQFDRAGRYHPDHAQADDRKVPPAGPNLVVTDTWVLYARPRSDNFFTADLERLRQAVETAASLPGPTVALVTEPSDEPTYVPSISGIGGLMGPRHGDVQAGSVDRAAAAAEQVALRQFFFPKAFNDEQIAIVERLESLDVEGVVVQGPPGTGKTHTIANIICHYLATGRRVLVTSKSEGALAVLRDQIPEGIRDLAISLLTSEREGLKQLEATVNLLASKIASLDARSAERDIGDGERRICELERRIAKIDAEMRSFADKHLSRLGAGADGDGILPSELAERIVRERERYVWFSDRPRLSQKSTFSDDDVAEARTCRKALGADLAYLGATLPSISDLPDAALLAAIHEDLANAARIERGRRPDAPVMSLSEVDSLARAQALLTAVEILVAVHETCSEAVWLANLYAIWSGHGFDFEPVRPLAELIVALSGPVARRVAIASYAVVTPEDAHTQADLIAAVERAASGQRAFALISFGKSEVRLAFGSIRILDKPPDGPEEWQKILEVLAWRSELARALARWKALAVEFALPTVPERPDDAARALEVLLANVATIAEAVRLHVPLVQTEVGRLFPYGLSAAEICSELDHCRRAAEAIRSEVSRHRLGNARAKLAAATEKLATCSGHISETIAEFLSAFVGDPEIPTSKIADEWTRLLTELERVRNLRPHLETVERVAARIAESGAPEWAQRLRSQPVEGIEDIWTPNDWRNAWNWAQADAHLRAIDGRVRLQELDAQRRSADDETRRLFHNVVRLRTLLTLKARITRRVDAALQMFLTAIRRIGKGTGKSASRLRRDAREAMESSYAAVPCWIMPTWRISESLPATLGSFDLVIFDEASQSDISALPALLRAKKVLIVGDDKQVSPTAAFIEEQKLRSLRMHYLEGQPFSALMLPGNSLYELALACYPGRRIMLKEHFRCVEPIIRFSFQFYTDEIVPVRVPKATERLSPPLIDVHVPDGRKDKSNRNFAEAEAIIEEVSRIVADPKMAGRSIGIISLIGAKQAQLIQMMLLERIGEDAYLRHDIACGDSAIFQGKEKDIVFLSMVECPDTCTSKTALPFQQRFNVALSRARDREYLFHSVTEDLLKPDDLKAKVLRHFKNPMEGRTPRTGDLMSLCESGFERDVLVSLLKLGYKVQPQVKVGPYSIDLVVEGRDDQRLAIELDGDQYHGPERWTQDLARQRVMERVGWRFWRCWGSSFRLDPDACIDDLVGSLNALGIQPVGSGEAPTVWTEFRTISRKSADEAAPSGAATTTGAADTAGSPADVPAEGNENIVEIGDRVQVQVGGDTRVRVVTLMADRHDPDLGIISAQHPSGAALLGAEEDEEIEFEIDNKSRHWMVIKIEKGRALANA
jgi:very-short-patch-repair endonuclease